MYAAQCIHLRSRPRGFMRLQYPKESKERGVDGIRRWWRTAGYRLPPSTALVCHAPWRRRTAPKRLRLVTHSTPLFNEHSLCAASLRVPALCAMLACCAEQRQLPVAVRTPTQVSARCHFRACERAHFHGATLEQVEPATKSFLLVSKRSGLARRLTHTRASAGPGLRLEQALRSRSSQLAACTITRRQARRHTLPCTTSLASNDDVGARLELACHRHLWAGKARNTRGAATGWQIKPLQCLGPNSGAVRALRSRLCTHRLKLHRMSRPPSRALKAGRRSARHSTLRRRRGC